MRKLIATGIIAAGLALAACGGGDSGNDLVMDYAECLANPASTLHVVAGSPTVEQALVNIRADLDSGANTMADIEAALELYCKDVE